MKTLLAAVIAITLAAPAVAGECMRTGPAEYEKKLESRGLERVGGGFQASSNERMVLWVHPEKGRFEVTISEGECRQSSIHGTERQDEDRVYDNLIREAGHCNASRSEGEVFVAGRLERVFRGYSTATIVDVWMSEDKFAVIIGGETCFVSDWMGAADR